MCKLYDKFKTWINRLWIRIQFYILLKLTGSANNTRSWLYVFIEKRWPHLLKHDEKEKIEKQQQRFGKQKETYDRLYGPNAKKKTPNKKGK